MNDAMELVPQGFPLVTKKLTVRHLQLADPADAALFLDLLDHYARDPMGGGEGLSADAREHLVVRLRGLSNFTAGLAFLGEEPVGLVNCFTGFSTFAARPLLNIHDLVVRDGHRGAGIGQALLQWAEQTAQALGCCKVTLEVLTGNTGAMKSYQRAGFEPYALDPEAGQAMLMQKKLPLN